MNCPATLSSTGEAEVRTGRCFTNKVLFYFSLRTASSAQPSGLANRQSPAANRQPLAVNRQLLAVEGPCVIQRAPTVGEGSWVCCSPIAIF